MKHWRAWIVALVAWLAAPAATGQVLIVLSDGTAGYREVEEELRAGLHPLRDGNVQIDTILAPQLAGLDAARFDAYELVVTVGLAAAQPTIAREHDVPKPPPTLCLMIPRQSFERLAPAPADGRERRLSALFIDQPLARQLDLVRLALPDKHRVGVILGPTSAALAGELKLRAKERDLSLDPVEVRDSSGVYGALQTVVRQSELLLVVPDPIATNADTIYGLLLTSYRAQLPVVGFSEGLAKAGALVSLFSNARQQGRAGAEIASRALSDAGGLPAPQYPKYFTVRVNHSVARSLGLRIEDEAALAEALAARAAQPEGAP
jgi:hypothetical protein